MRGGTFGFTRGRVMFWALVGNPGGWESGLRGLCLEQQEKPGSVFSFVAQGPSGVVAALADVVVFVLWFSELTGLTKTTGLAAVTGGFGWFSTAATGFGGGGGIMKDDISSDVSTLARFSSGCPLVCGGGGMVIVARNDSRSRFMRFVLFLNPLSKTESVDKKNLLNQTRTRRDDAYFPNISEFQNSYLE